MVSHKSTTTFSFLQILSVLLKCHKESKILYLTDIISSIYNYLKDFSNILEHLNKMSSWKKKCQYYGEVCYLQRVQGNIREMFCDCLLRVD